MKKILLLNLFVCFAFLVLNGANPVKKSFASRWSEERAQQWYKSQPWLVGCNYIPSSAINQIEMWHKDTFDAKLIDKELSWAHDLGFNTLRVFLSSVVWKNDSIGMKNRINEFLTICQKHQIHPFFVFFDDCWNKESQYGKQPDPKPGVHNSGWVKDPSYSLRKDTLSLYPILEKYVKDIMKTFGNDKRVLMWDLYNEPGNDGNGVSSLSLLKKVFEWARECNPSQPITSGFWSFGCSPINAFQLTHSDVVSYHNYSAENEHAVMIKYLKVLNRPLICTEYMARKNNSTFQSILPLLLREKVAAINWGFVSGKTNTIFAWGTPLPDVKEPEVWFHDIYRKDGTPFDAKEIDCIRSIVKKSKE